MNFNFCDASLIAAKPYSVCGSLQLIEGGPQVYCSLLVLPQRRLEATQQNIHGSVTGCGRQHPVTDPYTLLYRPGKVHVAYRLYIRICAALIQYRYGTDLLYGSVTDVLSYLLYTNCIYMFIQ